MNYAEHKSIAVHQIYEDDCAERAVLEYIRIKANFDFAENYEIEHAVETQQEFWVHSHVTLFICIVLYRVKRLQASAHQAAPASSDLEAPEADKEDVGMEEKEEQKERFDMWSEAHIGVSSDMSHDTLRATFHAWLLRSSACTRAPIR